jgi:putative heme iron utilization protein
MTQVRVQILLEPRQHTALKRVAKQANISVSEIIRQITDEYLFQVGPEKEDSVLQTLDHFKAIREKQAPYQGDPIAEIRAERELQQDENL